MEVAILKLKQNANLMVSGIIESFDYLDNRIGLPLIWNGKGWGDKFLFFHDAYQIVY